MTGKPREIPEYNRIFYLLRLPIKNEASDTDLLDKEDDHSL